MRRHQVMAEHRRAMAILRRVMEGLRRPATAHRPAWATARRPGRVDIRRAGLHLPDMVVLGMDHRLVAMDRLRDMEDHRLVLPGMEDHHLVLPGMEDHHLVLPGMEDHRLAQMGRPVDTVITAHRAADTARLDTARLDTARLDTARRAVTGHRDTGLRAVTMARQAKEADAAVIMARQAKEADVAVTTALRGMLIMAHRGILIMAHRAGMVVITVRQAGTALRAVNMARLAKAVDAAVITVHRVVVNTTPGRCEVEAAGAMEIVSGSGTKDTNRTDNCYLVRLSDGRSKRIDENLADS